jgi:ABC-type Fe3+/spermidine/putrescine transport system ATPase subunit
MLLDEPFSALDAPLRARLRHELQDLQREIATTTIIVTHDWEEAALLADELLVIEDGRVLQAGPVESIFSRPANETVAYLLGAENVSEGIAVTDNQIAIQVARFCLSPGRRCNRASGWVGACDQSACGCALTGDTRLGSRALVRSVVPATF